MNLIELQKILGEAILNVTNTTKTAEEHNIALSNAEYVAKIAKQMINNADIVLRSEKLMHEGYELENTKKIMGKEKNE